MSDSKDSTNLMKTSATELRRACPSTASIKHVVQIHIREMEAKIKEAHRGKQRSIRYDMVTNFEIPNMSNKDAQRHIFGTIIEQLETNDYSVKFTHNKKECYFVISWLSQQDKDEAERHELLIRKAKGLDTDKKDTKDQKDNATQK